VKQRQKLPRMRLVRGKKDFRQEWKNAIRLYVARLQTGGVFPPIPAPDGGPVHTFD
jgi:hypothetical protein